MHGSAGALFAQDPGKLQVQGREVKLDRRRDRVDLKNSMLFFANAYKQVTKTLGSSRWSSTRPAAYPACTW